MALNRLADALEQLVHFLREKAEKPPVRRSFAFPTAFEIQMLEMRMVIEKRCLEDLLISSGDKMWRVVPDAKIGGALKIRIPGDVNG